MKNGWQTKRIDEVCEIVNGGTPKTAVPQFWNGKHQWITPAEMGNRSNPFVSDTARTLSDSGLENSSARLLPPNSVILSSRAPIGHLVINTKPMAFNQGCKGLIPRNGIQTKFLYYYLYSVVDLLNSLGTGATFRELSVGKLRLVQIPAPPSPEQRRIVAVLDEAFASIAVAKANAEKNLQNAPALFESSLESLLSQRSRRWQEKTVAELVAEGVLVKPFDGNHGEIHPRKADYTAAGVPFIMACDLKDGHVDTKTCAFLPRKLADSLRVGFAKDGDVLISHKGTIGRSAIVHTDDDYIMLTPQVTSYRVKDATKLFNRFIRYYFMSPLFQREVRAMAKDGSTRAYIGITKQLSLRFRLPPLAEQRAITAKLDALQTETKLLESVYRGEIVGLEQLKKSVLHQAFTGNL